MDMKLEVLTVPVSDVDRAKCFYEKLGWRLDVDYSSKEGYRVIQFTPPGSGSSIIFGNGVTSARPGSIDRLVLAVYDIDAARDELVAHGVEVSEIFHDAGGSLGGGFHSESQVRAAGPDPQRRSYGSYASFSDPDGNVWMLQEIRQRLPGRTTNAARNGKATEILLETLKSAALAHGVHEKELGKADPDWPQWYAADMARRLESGGYHLLGPSA